MTDIKLFASDVDGTMTDGCMYYAENGLELKKFNFQDGMGFKLLRDLGIKTAIITSEDTPIVKKRADKLKADYLSMGTWTKLEFVQKICNELNITLSEVAYIGDDINDIELLKTAAFEAYIIKEPIPINIPSMILSLINSEDSFWRILVYISRAFD